MLASLIWGTAACRFGLGGHVAVDTGILIVIGVPQAVLVGVQSTWVLSLQYFVGGKNLRNFFGKPWQIPYEALI